MGSEMCIRDRLYTTGTLLTTVEYSYASTRCSTDLRYIVSYLPSRTKKRNADGCSSCYGTLFSATAVTDTIYQYDLRTVVGSSMIYSQFAWERISRTTFVSPQGEKDPKNHNMG